MTSAFPDLKHLRNPVVLLAFEGWNDAADAATEVINHFTTTYPTQLAWELDSEEYYDFQESRPRVIIAEQGRVLDWPKTCFSITRLPERDLVVVCGPEPNLRWRSFAAAIVSVLRSIDPELILFCGAMLTASPHTRPVEVFGSCPDAELGEQLGLEPSTYEGPTGIIGAITDACARAGLTKVVSLWAAVPHYVANPLNPKATLALLTKIETILGTTFDLDDLPELATAWERNVNELVSNDSDIAEYVTSLEEAHEEDVRQQMSGDAIAAEVERYLRRRNDRPDAQG